MKPRRRCTECRCWFEPSRTAAKAQKTCCPQCRKKRRRKLARRRRRRDLDGYRGDERERQRECRERRRAENSGGAKQRQMSRATLSAREAVLRDSIIESWDRQMKVSRAMFERRVGLLLGRGRGKPGQAGTGIADCHAPP